MTSARVTTGGERYTIAIAGATGLVGRECLRVFGNDPAFEQVIALVRRPLDATPPHAAKVEEHTVDYDHLAAAAPALRVTHLLIALGTTLKQAGSKENFHRVDHDYVVNLAKAGAEQGVKHLLVVSALGASADSRIFYNRVKAEMEDDIRSLSYTSVTIVRPSLLVGKRREFRLFERVARVVGFLVPGRHRPVHAHAVAVALNVAAHDTRPGLRILESDQIRKIAREPEAVER